MRKAQLEALDAVLIEAVDAVKTIVKDGPAVAMQRFNRNVEPPEKDA